MSDLPSTTPALMLMVFALGMRHGLDPDHLAAIDAMTRAASQRRPHAARWAHPGEGERFQALIDASIEEARAFYDAIFPRVREAKKHLEAFDFRALPPGEARLLDLLVAFMDGARHRAELAGDGHR